MDVNHVLMQFLGGSINNPNLSPQQREQATYLMSTFPQHQNLYRLMAQLSTLFQDRAVLHQSHRTHALAETIHLPVHHFAQAILAITNDAQVTPTVADIEGRPIELISLLKANVENALSGPERFKLHQTLVMLERVANEKLAALTRRYGYHWILRAGLQQYYYTKVIVSRFNFWRPDPRGNFIRFHAQRVCYEAMEARVRLNDVEKRAIINQTMCAPADAELVGKKPPLLYRNENVHFLDEWGTFLRLYVLRVFASRS